MTILYNRTSYNATIIWSVWYYTSLHKLTKKNKTFQP